MPVIGKVVVGASGMRAPGEALMCNQPSLRRMTFVRHQLLMRKVGVAAPGVAVVDRIGPFGSPQDVGIAGLDAIELRQAIE